jgi:CRP-like cAMP-binding protein
MHTYQMTVEFDVRHFRFTLESLCCVKRKCTYVLLGRGSGGRCSVFDNDEDLYKREGWGHIPKAPHPLRVGDVFLVGSSEFMVKSIKVESEEEKKLVNDQLAQRIRVLRNVPWMRALPPSQLATIADMLQLKRYKKGDFAYRQGDDATALFVVAEGAMELFYFECSGCEVIPETIAQTYDDMSGAQKTEKAEVKAFFQKQGIRMHTVKDVGPGGSFGERAITSGTLLKRSNCAICWTDALVWVLPRSVFSIERPVMNHVVTTSYKDQERALVAQYLSKVPFFGEYSVSELTYIAHMMEDAEYLAGEEIIYCGASSLKDALQFYIILSGECESTADMGLTWTSIPGPGSYFGDMALVSTEKTHFSVRAKYPSTLVRLSRSSYESFCNGHQADQDKILKDMTVRLIWE